MAWSDSKDIVDSVEAALDLFDWEAVDRTCSEGPDSLLARLGNATEPFPGKEAATLLKSLRRKRRFSLMAGLADAFLRAGAMDAEIRKLYGQALIDQGQLLGAERVLRDLIDDKSTPDRELDEALGLMGRIYKQEYVNASDPANARQRQNLAKAVSYYFEAFNRNRRKNIWQGINYVALLARAGRDGVSLPDRAETEVVPLGEVDAELKRRIEEDGELFYWDRAIDLEAGIAHGDAARIQEALHWYLRDRRADAFEYASTLRQLQEVWGLTQVSDAVHSGLKAAVLKKGGEGVQVDTHDVRRLLQKNFSADKDLPFQWWLLGLERCKAIARIEAPSGRHVGTGFLVNPVEFHLNSTEPILLTNWHVVSVDGQDPLSIPPEGAVACFEACGDNGIRVPIKGVLAFNRRLDCSFVSLEAFTSQAGICGIRVPPAEFDAAKKQRLYVIGYPGGRGLSFSLHDSRWLDSDGTRFHYRTPTETGNSGSPVFDDDNWMLVGLHHAGGKEMPRLNGQAGTYEANEALSIVAIQRAIATNPTS